MKYKYIEKKIDYDGSALKPLYAYVHHKVHGDSIVSFIGACNVSLEHMIDAEDFVVNAEIKADKMLHFIIEIFNQNLLSLVALQRLFVCITQNLIFDSGQQLIRSGDDLYLRKKNEKDKKLSVSIASCSAVSGMIHLGLNINNKGTPVETCGLNDFKIDPKKFATELMKRFCDEYLTIIEATQKVKPL